MPASSLPETWEMVSTPQPMGASLGFGNEDDSYVAYKLIEGKYNLAYHYVYQYNNLQAAQEGYVDLEASNFNDKRVTIDASWQTPQQLSYHSVVANQFYMACTINNVAGRREVCQLIAQYGRFVTVFHSVISTDTMSLINFNTVAKKLDEHMITKLGIDK